MDEHRTDGIDLYDLGLAARLFSSALRKVEERFYSFFQQQRYLASLSIPTRLTPKLYLKQVQIRVPNDPANLTGGRGFYVIATDYPLPQTTTTFKTPDGLVAVYRGEANYSS